MESNDINDKIRKNLSLTQERKSLLHAAFTVLDKNTNFIIEMKMVMQIPESNT